MNEFGTLRSYSTKRSRIRFTGKVAEAVNDGWEIINSGCDGGCFWVILRREVVK